MSRWISGSHWSYPNTAPHPRQALNFDQLADVHGITLAETKAETTSGLVINLLGRIAKLEDEVAFPVARLTVTQNDSNLIRRIHGGRTPPPAAETES